MLFECESDAIIDTATEATFTWSYDVDTTTDQTLTLGTDYYAIDTSTNTKFS